MLTIAVREYKSKKLIDTKEFPVSVSMDDDGWMEIRNTKQIVYEHNEPSMVVEWGFLNEFSFWPLPIKLPGQSGESSTVEVLRGQTITLDNVSLKYNFDEYSKIVLNKRVGWFR